MCGPPRDPFVLRSRTTRIPCWILEHHRSFHLMVKDGFHKHTAHQLRAVSVAAFALIVRYRDIFARIKKCLCAG